MIVKASEGERMSERKRENDRFRIKKIIIGIGEKWLSVGRKCINLY